MAVVEIHDPVGERAAASHHAGMIVVVDDSEADRAALVRPLEQAGYRVISSDNCDDALQAAHGCPDLILIDVRMLDRSGYTSCARLKADHRCGGAPVILTCSGATSGDDAMRAIEGGADAFLARPIDPIILLSTVKAWVRAHRADRERARLEDERKTVAEQLAREQDAVRESQHEMAEIIRLSPVPTVVYRGPEHVFSLVNAAHDRIMGKHVPGLPIRQAYTRDEAGETPAILDRVYRTGKPYVSSEVPYTVIGDDGLPRPIWIHEWYYPFRDLHGTVVGILGMAQDVTVSVLARLEVSTVLNALPAFITRVDTHERIVFINESNAKYFGPAEHILGKTMREYFGDEYYGVFKDKVQAALRGEAVEFEWSSRPLSDGLVHHFIVNYTPERSPDGAVVGFVTSVFNIDEIKNTEIVLERLRGEADTANRAKDEFLAMLGHELRNPLSPMLTALQLMRLRGLQSTEQDILERQVRHLTRLVDDLLDISRITRGKIELQTQPIELADAVAKAMEMSSPLLELRQHLVDVRVPPTGLTVRVDVDRIVQVISNVLTNAAKYSEPESRIIVEGTRDNERVRLRVKDEGVGIAPEMIGKVFDLFVQQVQTADRSIGGLGLGLTIVRNIVELHGGTVQATSAGLGKGSEFVIELPASAPARTAGAGAPAHAAETSPARLRESRILVVDDNEDAAETMQVLLGMLGYQVALAHDGPSALLTAATFKPDIALLDIGLPGMDGFELAGRLRELPGGARDIRLVAVTGYGQDSDRERSAAAGFNAHLVKPVDFTLLERMIEELRQQQQETGTQSAPAS